MQQELMTLIASDVLSESMFKVWHRAIFRDVIGITEQQVPPIYGRFEHMAANFISDLINTMELLDVMRLALFVPTSISDDDMFQFHTVHIKTVPNVATAGYSANDVDEVIQTLKRIQMVDVKKAKVPIEYFVPYRLCSPMLVIDPNTLLPGMSLSMTYSFRPKNSNTLYHPGLI
jgi:hypothetical protein